MISFASDYIAGAHPAILQRLMDTNMESLPGYGTDHYCQAAAEKIKAACDCPQADVFFISGGTQTNQLIIDTVLDPCQGVIAAHTGHINVHEAGAIEYSGHKVISLPGEAGKLKAQTVEEYVKVFYEDESHEHMVAPGMVYISFPTEYGTLYSKQELAELARVCIQYHMTLFIDGARLGYGLCGMGNDVSLQDIASLADVFYIGGTKVGALCGEAVVFTSNNTPKYFLTKIKQHGAMLAKGRLLGIQFDTLFTDDLYMSVSRHAMDMTKKLKALFSEKGYRFFLDSPTNQQFIILDNEKLKELEQKVVFSFWEKYDDTHTVVRFAASWSTSEKDIRILAKIL